MNREELDRAFKRCKKSADCRIEFYLGKTCVCAIVSPAKNETLFIEDRGEPNDKVRTILGYVDEMYEGTISREGCVRWIFDRFEEIWL